MLATANARVNVVLLIVGAIRVLEVRQNVLKSTPACTYLPLPFHRRY